MQDKDRTFRRVLLFAALAAAVSTAALPASAEPAPGPLAGSISARTCRAGGGYPLFSPFDQVGPLSAGTCLGGEYSLAAVRMPRASHSLI